MSYILDALRKADAERSRGSVPGLASQPLPAAMADTPVARAGRPGWAWAAGGAAVALVLVALAWAFWGRDAAPTVPPTAPANAPLLSAVPPAVVAAPPAPVIAPAPVAGAITLPVAPLPAPAPARVASPPPSSSATVPPTAPRQMPTTAPGGVAEASADPALRKLPSVAELPEAVRRQLPPLALGGSVWSEQPSSRFVMLDGQLLREGESFGPGLVVERIGPRSVRLAWRETRFEVRW